MSGWRYRDYLIAAVLGFCTGCLGPSYQPIKVEGTRVVDERVPLEVKTIYNTVMSKDTKKNSKRTKSHFHVSNRNRSYSVYAEQFDGRPSLEIDLEDKKQDIRIKLTDAYPLDGKVDKIEEWRLHRNGKFWSPYLVKDPKKLSRLTPLYEQAIRDIYLGLNKQQYSQK